MHVGGNIANLYLTDSEISYTETTRTELLLDPVCADSAGEYVPLRENIFYGCSHNDRLFLPAAYFLACSAMSLWSEK